MHYDFVMLELNKRAVNNLWGLDFSTERRNYFTVRREFIVIVVLNVTYFNKPKWNHYSVVFRTVFYVYLFNLIQKEGF